MAVYDQSLAYATLNYSFTYVYMGNIFQYIPNENAYQRSQVNNNVCRLLLIRKIQLRHATFKV